MQNNSPAFGGSTFEPTRDGKRLSAQLVRVREAMADGNWHTLDWLVEQAGGTVASVSARLRDLRKPHFGAHDVRSRCIHRGLWHYRVAVPPRQTTLF